MFPQVVVHIERGIDDAAEAERDGLQAAVERDEALNALPNAKDQLEGAREARGGRTSDSALIVRRAVSSR